MQVENERRNFKVCNPYGITTTDRRGKERDHAEGAILSFKTFNTSIRHLLSLCKCGDLEEVAPDADIPVR
jgi:hypothetical protein